MQVSPRVNSTMINNFIGRPVRVVGTVSAFDEGKTQMQIIASDGAPVTVILAIQNQGVTWEQGQVLEVIGAAQGNATPTVQEYTTIPLSKGFDMNNYNRLVTLLHSKQEHGALFM